MPRVGPWPSLAPAAFRKRCNGGAVHVVDPTALLAEADKLKSRHRLNGPLGDAVSTVVSVADMNFQKLQGLYIGTSCCVPWISFSS